MPSIPIGTSGMRNRAKSLSALDRISAWFGIRMRWCDLAQITSDTLLKVEESWYRVTGPTCQI